LQRLFIGNCWVEKAERASTEAHADARGGAAEVGLFVCLSARGRAVAARCDLLPFGLSGHSRFASVRSCFGTSAPPWRSHRRSRWQRSWSSSQPNSRGECNQKTTDNVRRATTCGMQHAARSRPSRPSRRCQVVACSRLHVACCVLHVVCGTLSVARCPMLAVGCMLSLTRCRLLAVGCVLSVARCRLHVVGCVLSVARCRLHVVSGTLSLARCRLHVVRCRPTLTLLRQLCHAIALANEQRQLTPQARPQTTDTPAPDNAHATRAV
jgi:hypothetical protein